MTLFSAAQKKKKNAKGRAPSALVSADAEAKCGCMSDDSLGPFLLSWCGGRGAGRTGSLFINNEEGKKERKKELCANSVSVNPIFHNTVYNRGFNSQKGKKKKKKDWASLP